jgi:CBS domain-containing protein
MQVSELMDKNFITIKKGTTYEEVFKLFTEHSVGGAPVVDEENMVIGYVSEKDLFRVLFPYYTSYYNNPELYTDYKDRESKAGEIKNHKVEVFMNRDITVIHPEDSVMKAGALTLAKNVSSLPVVEDGQLLGVIKRKDIYQAILKQQLM